MSDNQKKLTRMPNRIPRLDTDDLRLIVGTEPDYDYAILLGQNSPLDNRARDYMWDSRSTIADDGDWYIRPNDIPFANAGRWRKVGRGIVQTFYKDIVNSGTSIQQDIIHNFNTIGISIEVYLRGQTINGIAGCDLKVDKAELGATLFEVGAKDEDTVIVNMTDISAGTYRFVLKSVPYVDLEP